MIYSINKETIEQFLIESEINLNPTPTQITREVNDMKKSIDKTKLSTKTLFYIYFMKNKKTNLVVEEKTNLVVKEKVWITEEMEQDLKNIKQQQKDINKKFNAKNYLLDFKKRKHNIKFKYCLNELIYSHVDYEGVEKDSTDTRETELVQTVDINNTDEANELIVRDCLYDVIEDMIDNNIVKDCLDEIIDKVVETKTVIKQEPNEEDYIKEYILIEEYEDEKEEVNIKIINDLVYVSYDDGETYDDLYGIYYYSKEHGDYVIENEIEGQKNRFQKEIYKLDLNDNYELIHKEKINN